MERKDLIALINLSIFSFICYIVLKYDIWNILILHKNLFTFQFLTSWATTFASSIKFWLFIMSSKEALGIVHFLIKCDLLHPDTYNIKVGHLKDFLNVYFFLILSKNWGFCQNFPYAGLCSNIKSLKFFNFQYYSLLCWL